MDKKCLIEGCMNQGNWSTGLCPTCRQYLRRVEERSLAWRLARQEVVMRWSARLEVALSRKGTVTHLRSRRHGKA